MTCGNSKDQAPDTGAGMTDQGASPSTPSREDKAFNLARVFEATEYYRHRASYSDRLCFNIVTGVGASKTVKWMFLGEDTVSPIWKPCHLNHANKARKGVVLPVDKPADKPAEDEVFKSPLQPPRRPVLGHGNLSLRDGTVLIEQFMDNPRVMTGSKIKVRHPFNDTVITLTELYSLIPPSSTEQDWVHCSKCGKRVSNPINGELVIRAYVQCAECIGAEAIATQHVELPDEKADDKPEQPDAHQMLSDAAAGFLAALAGVVDRINQRPVPSVEELIIKNRAVYDAELETARYIVWKQRFKVGDIITSRNYDRVRHDFDWLPCLGQGVKVDRFPLLFGVLGNDYGGSNGTFGIPNLGTGYFIKAM